MTRNEYKYWFLKTYGKQHYDHAGCGGPVLMVFSVALLLYLIF